MTARLSHQVMKTDNTNDQRRGNASYSPMGTGCSAVTPGSTTCDMLQSFELEQRQTAFNVQFDSMFEHGGISHILTYGLDLSRQEVETYRDGTVINRNTGVVTKNVAGEVYPLRDFPNGKTDTLGAFIQDEIGLFGNRLTLTPGIRYDRTQLKPDHDPLSVKMLNSLGLEPENATWSRVSPKLGVQWRFDPVFSTYGQIASGFRAPNYNEVNGLSATPPTATASPPIRTSSRKPASASNWACADALNAVISRSRCTTTVTRISSRTSSCNARPTLPASQV